MVDHIPQIASLPINSDQLTARTPIPMRLIIARTDPHPLRIHPDEMRPIMLNQIAHPAPLLEHLVRRVLREREDVLGRVLFLLVQPAAFDADGVDEEGEQRE